MKNNLSYIDNVLIQSMLKGDIRSIYKILLDFTESDHLSILIYAEHTSLLYQADIDETIDTNKLDHSSLLGIAFKSQQIGIYKHVASEKNYHRYIDNPYDTRLKSQILVPILNKDELVGIVRFSKNTANRHTYTQKHIDTITKLIPTLIQVIYSFQPSKFAQIKADNQDLSNSIESDKEVTCVESAIVKINSLLDYITQHTENNNINELLMKSEENIKEIHTILSDEYIVQDIDRQNSHKNRKNIANNINILIADDVKLNTAILEAMLKDKRYTIHIAHDGDIALEKMEKLHKIGKDVDILFLDQHMPNMLGSEVVENIKKRPTLYTNSHMIIVSITNDPKSISKDSKNYHYQIKKPFNKKEIKETMNKIDNINNSPSNFVISIA